MLPFCQQNTIELCRLTLEDRIKPVQLVDILRDQDGASPIKVCMAEMLILDDDRANWRYQLSDNELEALKLAA